MSFTSRRIRGEAPLSRAAKEKKAATLRRSTAFGWLRASTVKKAMALTAKTGRWLIPVVRFFRTWQQQERKEEKRAWRVGILKKTAVALLSIFLALFVLGGVVQGLAALQVISLKSMFFAAGAEIAKDKDGFTNVLLLGHGGPDHDGVDLNDTIMVASIDPGKTKSAVLLSLPRDLYALHTEKMGKGRINSLYRDYKSALRSQGLKEQEASQQALKEFGKEIGEMLGLDIHHVIKVDFNAFVKVVDAMDGVDIVVPQDIVDPEYPGPNYTYQTFAMKAGPQHLDGETALKYARSRHTTSDFDRSARQQQLLAALAEKAKAEGVLRSPSKLTSLFQAVAKNTETTLSIREIIGLAALGAKIDQQNIISVQLSTLNGLYGEGSSGGGFLYNPPRELFDGASVLLPVSIPEYPVTWRQIQHFVSLLFRSRSIFLARPELAIFNAGGETGSANRLGAELSRYAFDVTHTGNAKDMEKIDVSFIAPRTDSDAPAATFLANILGMEIGILPPQLPLEDVGTVTIILGKDYEYTPLQDLLPSSE